MIRSALSLVMVLGIASLAQAYPGGTPTYQTDVAPYCAGCHSSINEQALAGAGDRATKEVADNKHLASIAAGRGAYEELSEADRQRLIELIRAVDANSTVTVQFPPQVAPVPHRAVPASHGLYGIRTLIPCAWSWSTARRTPAIPPGIASNRSNCDRSSIPMFVYVGHIRIESTPPYRSFTSATHLSTV